MHSKIVYSQKFLVVSHIYKLHDMPGPVWNISQQHIPARKVCRLELEVGGSTEGCVVDSGPYVTDIG